MPVSASRVVTAVTHSKRQSGLSLLQAAPVLQLLLARLIMMACDVSMPRMPEQAELEQLAGTRWSDTLFDAPLVPGCTNEFAEFLAADADMQMATSTSDAVMTPFVDDEPTAAIVTQQLNSTVAAAKKRERGPTMTEKRLRAVLDAEKAEQGRQAKQRRRGAKSKPDSCGGGGGGGSAQEAPMLSNGGQTGERRGRARLNAPLTTGATAAAGAEFARRSRGLEAAGEFRRSKSMRAVAPAGGANFSSAPDRTAYAAGEIGDDDFEKDLEGWADSNLNDAGVEARTLDARELKVGMFGDFAETRGHGKFVEWVLEPLGWKVQPVIVDGVIAVPRPVMIMDWVLRVRRSLVTRTTIQRCG